MKPLYSGLLLSCLIVSPILCIVLEIPGTFKGSCVTCKLNLEDDFLSTCISPCDDSRGLRSVYECVYQQSDLRCKHFFFTCLNPVKLWKSNRFFTTAREKCKSRHFDYTNKEEQLRIVRSNGEYQFTCTNQRTVLTRIYLIEANRPACIPVSGCPEKGQCITVTAINNTIQELTTPLPDSTVSSRLISLQHILVISILSLGIVTVVLFLLVHLQRRALSSCEQGD